MTRRAMAIDFGTVRVGLAVGDDDGIIASPRDALVRSQGDSLEHLVQRVLEVADERGSRAVRGRAAHPDGRHRGAGCRVGAQVPRGPARGDSASPVEEIDERLTTKQSHAMLKQAGVRHKKRKGKVDTTAALLMLRDYQTRKRREES